MNGGMWLSAEDCSLADLMAITSETTSISDYPWAAQVLDGVLLYSASALRPTMADARGRRVLQAELARALSQGPGIVVFTGAFADTDVADGVSGVFDDLIDEQRTGAPGDRDRVWNALARLAHRAPDRFVEYYGNDVIALACEAWLGPGYQVTSQVNVVNPGAAAQEMRPSYPFGSLPVEAASRFPAPAHAMSSSLTLQGLIAHTDMPVESGPTKYLPHSQKYLPGQVAWRRPEFREYAERNHVQMPLFKGDAVFFNPAVLHGSGANSTRTVRRMANLLQVSSAFGLPVESVDREALVLSIYDALVKADLTEGRDVRSIENAIAAAAQDCATNAGRDSVAEGQLAATQADLVRQSVAERWPREQLALRLADWRVRREP